MSPTSLIRPFSSSAAAVLSPRCSMSIAPRRGEVHDAPVHLRRAVEVRAACHRLALGAHELRSCRLGQCVGMTNLRSLPVRRLGMGATTSGMTSPARRTTTVSPMSRPLRSTSSALCRVATPMVTPPTLTGSRTAKGVTAPVRPMLTMMSLSLVVCSSAGNL